MVQPALINSVFVNPNRTEVTTELPDYAITDPARVGEVLSVLDQHPYYAFDVETTGLDFSRDKMHGASFSVESGQDWYVFGNALEPMFKGLVDLHYRKPNTGVIGHNIKFDLHFAAPYGFRPRFIADTQMAQRLVNENTDRGLKALADIRLGIPDLPEYKDLVKEATLRYTCKTKKCGLKGNTYHHPGDCPECLKPLGTTRLKMDEVTIYDIPLGKLVEYAAHDTRLTFDLWQVLKMDLKSEGFYKFFFDYEMPFLYVLLDMESNGIYIDQPAVREIEVEIKERLEAAQSEWDRITGGVNYNSNLALPEYLFNVLKLPVKKKTKGGAASTDALTLQRLEAIDTSGSIKALRTLRQMEKLLGTYVYNFQMKVNADGRLRTNFNQDGAVTGRLSSSGTMNLQNIPSRSSLGKKIRKAFTAQGDDMTMVVCDYSQLELRIVAHYSKEAEMIRVFEENGDPHGLTATKMNVERHVGKTINFGSVYGQGADTLCDTIEAAGQPRPSTEDAKRWLEDYREIYPQLNRWKWDQVDLARTNGFVTTLLGRKRRLPEINSYDKSARARAERQSYNAPIQGSAADVTELAMLNIDPYLSWYDAKMLFQVHDEIGFEVPKAAAEEFKLIVQREMEAVGEFFNLRPRLEATPGVGRSWAEAK